MINDDNVEIFDQKVFKKSQKTQPCKYLLSFKCVLLIKNQSDIINDPVPMGLTFVGVDEIAREWFSLNRKKLSSTLVCQSQLS